MAVRKIADHPRCKICRSPHRDEIDALLEIRHNAGRDEAGVRVTQMYVMKKMAEFGIENPTVDNVKLHAKNHVEFVTDELAAQMAEGAAELLERIQNGETVDADAVLDFIVAQGHAELVAKVMAGQKTGIGVETILKAIQVKTSRRSSEAQSELLRTLGAGIGAAIGSGAVQLPAAPEDDVIEDADYAEIEA